MQTAPALPSASSPASATPTWLARTFAGLTWRGVALITLLCLVNSARRTVRSLPEISWLEWLTSTARLAALGMIVAIPVALAVVVAFNLAPRRPALRYPILAFALVGSAMLSIGLALFAEAGFTIRGIQEAFNDSPLKTYLTSLARYVPLCVIFAVVFVYLRVADESAMRAREAERDRQLFLQRMEEARLRMLQAQIEPHFLFNTLANVRRLYQTEPGDGATMLDNLMRYFAVALPQMRATDSTLGREATLSESYLEIQRIRMGRRLTFDIDIPEHLRDSRLPPMMLLTLVENAIKHGLAPLPEGGHVNVTASVNGNELHVRVADNGRGFAQSSGGGTGLANIRARLVGVYGPAARLTLALNTPRGVTSSITVPLSAAAVGSAA